MFKLTKVKSQIYLLNFKSQHDLTMAFLRYQEFYEAFDDRFRGKKFTLAKFMSVYSLRNSGPRSRQFTYTVDWSGFNIPLEIIKQVRDLGIDDPNHYDSLMYGIYELINTEEEGKPVYLIGTYGRKGRTHDHEMAHAMFYLDSQYRETCEKLINSIPKNLLNEIFDSLRDGGYCDKVLVDETQAYIVTGEIGFFDDVKDKTNMADLRKKILKVYNERLLKFLKE